MDLLGLLWLLGLEINAITAINLVMAVGLVVDYSAHIAHNICIQDGSLSRDDRCVRDVCISCVAGFRGSVGVSNGRYTCAVVMRAHL